MAENFDTSIVLGVVIILILIPVFGALISGLTSVFDNLLFGRIFAIAIMGGAILIFLKLADKLRGF